jgi:protein involved in polysaccharide export with SLBB domain
MIAQAGGVDEGAGKTLFVFRQAPDGRSARLSIPLNDLILKGDPTWNIWVRPGDVLSIPLLEQISVSVLGAVSNPGTIAFAGGEGATLLNAVARAGGLKGASKSGVKIKRRDAAGKESILVVDLGDIISGKKPDVMLENNDIIVIKESFF